MPSTRFTKVNIDKELYKRIQTEAKEANLSTVKWIELVITLLLNAVEIERNKNEKNNSSNTSNSITD